MTEIPDDERTGWLICGRFYCQCGASYGRGPVDGVNTYCCLRCGENSTLDVRVLEKERGA